MTPAAFLRALRAVGEPDPARILDALLEVSGAERGFLVLRRGGELRVHAARDVDRETAEGRASRTLVQRALDTGRPVLASGADVSTIRSLQEQKVRAACVLPLPGLDGAVTLDARTEAAFPDPPVLGELAAELDRAFREGLELAERRERERDGDLAGASRPMRELHRMLDRLAAAPYPVLVVGESGTGKELVAREVHRRSPRASGPFVAANCAALPETLVEAELFGHARGAFTGAERDRPGLFEQARGGTLFLDEVACLSAGAQESLLRVLETGELRRVGGTRTERADVRVVAATHEDLGASGEFRRDLFYRLDVLRVDLPPLRERREDLPLLAERFLDRVARETGGARRRLSKGALGALLEHRWPGNVRELLNALRRAASLAEGDVLEAADFAFLRPREAGPDDRPILSLDEYVRDVLVRWEGKLELQEIADRLGLSRKTLWEKKKRLGL